MLATNSFVLAPMIRKLVSRSDLSTAETDALQTLPYRWATSDPGTFLVREGDKPSGCILLLSGFAYRSKITGNGARQILSVHLSGDFVDLQNSLLETADHNVQALTRVEVAYVAREHILDVATTYPAIARALWRDTLVDGSLFREWLVNLGRRDARQRISHLLCELALRQQAVGICQGPRFEWPMTQEQIGDATGMTNVHVSRTLRRMRSDGLISSSSRSVTITDWSALQAAGDFNSAYLHQPTPIQS